MPETVNCPECGKKLRVPDNLLGRTVSCPGCGKKFTAEAESEPPGAAQKGPSSRRAEEEPEERPSRRRPREDDEDDEDDRPRRRRPRDEDDEDEDDRPRRRRPRDEDEDEDEEDRPRRRRARDEDEDEEEDRPRRRRRGRRVNAAAATKAPGIALLVVGILGLLAGLFYVVQAINGKPLLGPQAQPGQAEINPALYWVFAAVTLLWGAVVTLGGVKLMQLQSRGSIMVACIFAMLPCNPCCLAGLPIGIWALVVLARPDVKGAFG